MFETTDTQPVVLSNETSMQLLQSSADIGAPVSGVSDENVIMLAVDPSQLGTMGYSSQVPNQVLMTESQMLLAPSSNPSQGPTTIDITDAGGEVVQQFILPDDLQLEEGQTLVMIQGEDGQPQLAIVNQAGKFDLCSITCDHTLASFLFQNMMKKMNALMKFGLLSFRVW